MNQVYSSNELRVIGMFIAKLDNIAADLMMSLIHPMVLRKLIYIPQTIKVIEEILRPFPEPGRPCILIFML
jgi:hypothetical protein